MSEGVLSLALEVEDSPSAEDVEAIHAELRAFNERFLGPADHRPLAVLARDHGRMIGGLIGETGRGFLHVDLLWVEAGHRGAGLGSCLLAAAEREAVARGCGQAWLGTYDFQACRFYEKQGYRSFGVLDGFARGHRSIFLTKSLAG